MGGTWELGRVRAPLRWGETEGSVKLDDVVRQLQQGSRLPQVSERQKTLAWIRFFSEAERLERQQARPESPGRFGAA